MFDYKLQKEFGNIFEDIKENVNDYDTLLVGTEIIKIATERLNGDLNNPIIASKYEELHKILEQLKNFNKKYYDSSVYYRTINGKIIVLKEYDTCYQLNVVSPYDLTDYPYAKMLKGSNTWKIYEYRKLPINYIGNEPRFELFGEYSINDFNYMLESYKTLVDTYESVIDKS